MAIAIDASSPAFKSGAVSTLTTASFTPPAGALLVVLTASDTSNNDGTSSPAVTDSVGLSWTERVERSKPSDGSAAQNGNASIWTAVVGSSTSMTVTITMSGVPGDGLGLYVAVVTGADTSTMNVYENSGTSTISINPGGAAPADGCLYLGVNGDWNARAVPTAGTGVSQLGGATVSANYTIWAAKRTNLVNVADGTVGITSTAPTSTANNTCLLVLRPAATTVTLVPGTPRKARRGLLPRRGHIRETVPPQFNPPFPFAEVHQPRRVRGLTARHARTFAVPAAPVPPPLPGERRRTIGVRLRQRSAPALPVPVPGLPLLAGRHRGVTPSARRTRVLPPPLAAAAPPPVAPALPLLEPHRLVRLAATRRGRVVAVFPLTVTPVTPPTWLPDLTRHARRLLARRHSAISTPPAGVDLPPLAAVQRRAPVVVARRALLLPVLPPAGLVPVVQPVRRLPLVRVRARLLVVVGVPGAVVVVAAPGNLTSTTSASGLLLVTATGGQTLGTVSGGVGATSAAGGQTLGTTSGSATTGTGGDG